MAASAATARPRPSVSHRARRASIAPPRAAAGAHALPPLALKEGAAACAALARGEATTILRAGGIAESGGRGFELRGARFFLAPTAFHDGEGKTGAPDPSPASRPALLTLAAEVTGAWQVPASGAPAAAAALGPWLAHSPSAAAARAAGGRPATLLELRVWRLVDGVPIDPGALRGCSSWAALAAGARAGWAGSPALDDSAFSERAAAMRAAMRRLAPAELDVGGLTSRDD